MYWWSCHKESIKLGLEARRGLKSEKGEIDGDRDTNRKVITIAQHELGKD